MSAAIMRSARRMLILVAGQTRPAIAARRGDYPAWIREKMGDAWPFGFRVHDARTANVLPSALDADAFVITGSSSSVTERAPWMLRLEALIAAIVASGKPLLGICFGHQLIAQAMGGRVISNPLGREVGTMRVHRTGDGPLFRGLPRDFDVQGTHGDVVASLPPCAEVLATTPLDSIAAFRLGSRGGGSASAVWGVQFHPEFDADIMRGYVIADAEALRAQGSDPSALLAGVKSTSAGPAMLKNFAAMAHRERHER